MTSRWLCYGIVLALVMQGLTLAVERVAPGGHFHLASLAAHAHDDDDGDGDHHDSRHFHSAIGHHEHAPQENGVVHVDEGSATTPDAAITLKRLTLDQEQVTRIVPPAGLTAATGAPILLRAPAFRSHVADPLEPPPRHFAS
jgi:hypothetical protein